MRLFTGFPYHPLGFESVLRLLRARLDESCFRWSAATNAHLTLHFLGEVDEDRLPALSQALEDACAGLRSVPLRSSLPGVFPQRGTAQVIWLGVEPCPALMDLQDRAAVALGQAGFALERRPYVPHVTLARARRGGRPRSRGSILASLGGVDLPVLEQPSGPLRLYESRLGPAGVTHEERGRFPRSTVA